MSRTPRPLLHELIMEQAARTPDSPAVQQWERRVSYRELLTAATALARRLRALGVGAETRVGVCHGRSPDLVLCVLAVLMAGGSYVPLDPAHPRRRLVTIVEDAGIGLILADAAGRAALGDETRATLLDPAGPPVDGGPEEARADAPVADPAQAAYILYTSGSTGRPKGVVVSHGNVVSFVTATAAYFKLDDSCRSAGFASLGFDASVLDLYTPLTVGGCVQLAPEADRIDPARLQRFLSAHRVNWAMLPPAVLPLLDADELSELRDLMAAGEPAGPEQVERWSRPEAGRRFHNWYGPTETTVVVVCAELTGAWTRPLPLGRPLPGNQAHILDENLRPCPRGVVGELYIGGPQVSRGYLDRPALTAERYVPDPVGGEPGARLYRTGDRVVMEEDGRIGYLGRADRQVKIQGQRAEIGEIETALRAHPRVGHAIVDLGTGPAGLKELVAYLSPADAPDLAELREHCAERLPAYMIPTRLVRLPILPLNVSGKVDLERLRTDHARVPVPPTAHAPTVHVPTDHARVPVPPIAQDKRAGVPSADDVPGIGPSAGEPSAEVRAVMAAWAEAFESPEPGPEDDFFLAGGHSLIAMRLVAAVRRRLGREVSVADLFAGRTVAGFAQRVARGREAVTDGGPARGGGASLSPAQRRMWFVEQLAPGTPAHNIAMAWHLSGPLDVPALRAALAAVAARHDVLRWRVPQSGGVPRVAVDPPGEVPLPFEDVEENAVPARLETEARTPFDLAAGPLWRARLLRTAPGEHVLAITAHHVVFDGWSQHVLSRDLAAAMRATTLEAVGSYADYVTSSLDRERLRGEADLTWWHERLKGAPAVLDLPADHERPPVQTFAGAAVHAEVGARVAAAVRELARTLGATPYTVLLTAFAQVLRRLSGRDDLIVGAPVADRGDPAYGGLVGCMVQILPLRLRVDDDESFSAAVRHCQDELGAALAHADVRLERVVERLGLERDLSRNPLVQVLFNMYNYAAPRFEPPGLAVRPLLSGLPGSLFDLTLYVGEEDGRYVLQAVYNPGVFRAARIEALVASYLHLLAQLVAAADLPVRRSGLRPPPPPEPVRQAVASEPVRQAVASEPERRTVVSEPVRRAVVSEPVRQAVPELLAGRAAGVVERVLDWADRTPDAVAITGEGGELTYAELARRIRRTATGLTETLRQPGEVVAVLGERHVEMPALLLGVLAGGARWAVLDAALPPERLAAQATVVAARALIRCPGTLVPEALAAALPAGRGSILPAEGNPDRPAAATPHSADVSFSGGATPRGPDVSFPGGAGAAGAGLVGEPLERGYLAFTSGSSGEPKPVRTRERPLVRFLAWYPEAFGLTGEDRFALLAGVAHDPFLRDAFVPLVLGATLHVPHQDLIRDPARLATWLAARKITVAHLTPQLARLISTAGVALPALRLVLFAGDQLTESVVVSLRGVAPGARLVNTYGTTETPQVQAMHEITERPGPGGRPVPVGHGVDGTELLVMAHGRRAAVGELGEVIIRGDRLAEGYLDEELTRERFSPAEPDTRDGNAPSPSDTRDGNAPSQSDTRDENAPRPPHTPDGNAPSQRVGDRERRDYRTGDLGRYDPEGRVVLAGRADRQVKVRGYRVELGEIEAVLGAHPGVLTAVVVGAGRDGERLLRAYAVPAGADVNVADLRRHLRARLPEYAVPADVVLLSRLPLTPNGKVDLASLPEPSAQTAHGGSDELTTPTERIVAGVWREVLGLPRIHAEAGFFEIGGHSLATARVQSRLSELLGRQVLVVDIFRHPTIRALAAHLDGGQRSTGPDRASRRIAARQARPAHSILRGDQRAGRSRTGSRTDSRTDEDGTS